MAGTDQCRTTNGQLPTEMLLVADIHGAGRLIEEGKPGSGEQHLGEGHALLFAHRQHLGSVQFCIESAELAHDIREIDPLQQTLQILVGDPAVLPRIHQLAAQAAQQHVQALR